MKLTLWKKLLVWQLVLCMLIPSLPLEWTRGFILSARAQAEDRAAHKQTEDAFMALTQQAEGMEAHTDGQWRYAVIAPDNYAVVLGHADPSARELTLPDRLGGADVVGIAAGALSDHAQLESISLPGNVNAVADNAIPRGTLVRGYHGTYAHSYALGNGYPFQSRSAYDFAQGVIDYADVRTDAFVRHSAHSLSLRKLEAARLHEGSVFFLVDPDNAYQISYYRVLSLEEKADGFVDVRCETPVMDEVMSSFSGRNEVMVLDPSTLVLGEGVSFPQAKAGGVIDKISLPLDITLPGEKVNVKITGSYAVSFVAKDYQGTKDSEKSATIDQTETLSMSVTLEPKGSLSAENAFKGSMGSIKDIANRATSLAETFDAAVSKPYAHPLGVGYVFSYAGILTLQVQLTLDLELKGSGTLTYKSETVTTYHGDTEGNSEKSTVVMDDSITGSAQIKGKAGVKAEANLYLYCICVFQVSGFVGLEAELKYEIVKLRPEGGKIEDYGRSINMMDCLKLKVKFVVEVGIRAGVLKVFNVDLPFTIAVGTKFTLVDRTLVDKHLHLMDHEQYVELLTGKTTQGKAKDQEHDADECPYGKASLEVRLSIPVEKQKALYMQFDNLDPGFTINEPEDPTLPYDDYKLTYWYDSEKTYAANQVTFPYTIEEGENLLYARILKKYNIHFIYEDGTEVCEPAYLFPGDTFTLPQTDRPTIKWLRVESPYNIKEHREQLEAVDGVYTAPFGATSIYMCAFEAPEIEVTFYESVDGGMMYESAKVISKAGQTVEAPETTMSEHYADAGWRLLGGEDITMPYTIPVMQTEPIKIVHFLGIKPAEDDFTWSSGTYPSPSSGQSNQLVYEIMGRDYEQYVVIYGRREQWTDEDGYVHYSPTRNLVIPAYIEGWPVREIRPGAFNDVSTLTTVTLPSTLSTIAKEAFKNCTSLRKVDASACTYSLRIGESAFEGCTNLTDFSVGSDVSVYYGQCSFAESGIVTAPNIVSMGYSAFSDCTRLQRAEVLASCSSIADYAFYGCTKLREVEIAQGVKSIGSYAFSKCASLLEIELPYGIDSYGSYMFGGCTSLKKLIVHGGGADTLFDMSAPKLEYVEIGEGFTEIDENLFNGVRTLQTVILPESLRIIGKHAFNGTSISEFDLPENLQQVGEYAFANNPCLTSIELNAATVGKSTFQNCPAMTSAKLEGMSVIPDNMFDGCVSLAEVTFPAVTQIGSKAFNQCAFEEIVLPEGLNDIGKEAFYSCENLKKLDMPSTLKSIGEKALYGCGSLEKISLNMGLEVVSASAFAECSALEEVILPDSVTTLNSNFVKGCVSLKKLYISGGVSRVYCTYHIGESNSLEYLEFGEGVTEIGSGLPGEYYPALETIIFPSSLEIAGVNNGHFKGCGVRNVIMRGAIKNVGVEMFMDCPNLENVIIEGEGVTVGKRAFANTPAMRTVYCKGVEILQEAAFRSSGVESVVLDEGIKEIGLYAFKDCDQMESFSSASTLTSFGSGALHNCDALKELRVGGRLNDMIFRDPGYLNTYSDPSLRVLEIGAGITVIPEDMFAGMVSELEELSLPEGLVEIQRWAFKDLGEHIREIKLPESLEIISFGAFEGSHLERVELPAKVRDVRSGAFENSRSLKSVTIHGEQVTLGYNAFQGCVSLEEINIRGSVKSIGASAFSNCGLKEVTLTGSIASIGGGAFANNLKLRSFTLQCPGVQFGNGVVSYCDNLEYLSISGIETITRDMFNSSGGLIGLRHLVIGEGVKSIGEDAFHAMYVTGSTLDYSQLETLSLPASLEVIGSNAFYGTGIRELILPQSGLKSIGRYAFYNCKRLETVILGGDGMTIDRQAFYTCGALKTLQLSGVKTIGYGAFDSCDIRELQLPEGLETIDREAFADNKNLSVLVIPDSVTTYGYDPFDNCDKLVRIRIGGGTDLTQSYAQKLLTLPDSVRHVVVGEGPAELMARVFWRSYNSQLETVTFPESMTVIRADNLSRCRGAKWVKVSSAMETIEYDAGSSGYTGTLTIITDTYNEVVAQYAAETNAVYIPLDDGVPEHTVQFYLSLDGVTGAEPVSVGKTNLLDGLELPQAPAQEGYRFTGWYYDAACTVPVAEGDRLSEDAALYAGYVPNDVTLFALRLPAFAEMSGTQESSLVPQSYVLYAKQEQVDGAAFTLPQEPVLEGYVFTGWYMDVNGYRPFDPATGSHPGMLYGGFKLAGMGGMTQDNATGATITRYAMMENDATCITLPETMGGRKVTAIGAQAFMHLPVTDVVIPAYVTDIDPQAFQGADALAHLHVDSRNTSFASVNGVLYTADMSVLVRYPQGRRAATFVVPETVAAIAPGAFQDCTYLRSITLNDSLESIGENAFAGSALQKVTLPDSVKRLGDGAFVGCQSLTEFIAHGLESIGENVLPGSPALAVRGPVMTGALRSYVTGSTPLNLTYNIRYLTVMDGSKELAAHAVEAGAALPDQAQGVTAGAGRIIYALYSDAALTQMVDAAMVMPDQDVTLYADVRSIFECEAITLATGETGLVLTAYNGNGGEVELPQRLDGKPVIALGEGLLAAARGKVTCVVIGSGVVSIADTALQDKDGHAYDGSIQADAFSYAAQWAEEQGYPCTSSVYTLTFNTMGGARMAPVQAAAGALIRLSVPVKTGAAFGGWYLDEACTSPVQVDETGLYCLPGSHTTLYALWTDAGDRLPFAWEETEQGVTITGYTGSGDRVDVPRSINGVKVTAIAPRAFLGKAHIISLTLPDTLQIIGESAFARMTALTAITIPDSVKEIGYAAFRGCSALAQAHIGAGLENLGEQAFYGAAALKAFTAGEGGAFSVAEGALYHGDTLVCVPAGMMGKLTIPEHIERIAPYAMAASSLEEVSFHAALTFIGEGALYDCDSLTHISFADGDVPGVVIPAMFAAGSDALRSVSLGSGVYAVGRGAFLNCTALTNVSIAPQTSAIGESAFAGTARGMAITGVRGSAAHAYAQENGTLFYAMDGSDITTLLFDAPCVDIVLGRQLQLTVTAQPAVPEGEKLVWSSSNEQIVQVTDGKIRGIGRGSATVTVMAQSGASASIEVTVRGVPAEDAAFAAEELFVPLGGQASFELLFTPAWADTACTWSAEDESIARVNEQGVVSGLKLGSTTLRVNMPSGVEASAVLHVYIPTETITLPESEWALTMNAVDNAQVQLHAAVTPSDATFPDIVYQSENTGVVTVSDEGVISIAGVGETTITMTNTYTTGEPAVLRVPVEVAPYDITGVQPPQIPDKPYNGASSVPDFDWTIGGRKMTLNKDYTIQHDKSSSVGEHTVTITGTGLFTGVLTTTFRIVEKQAEIIYNGEIVYEELSWYDLNYSYTTNVNRSSVTMEFSAADDLENWTEDIPTAYGDYVMRLSVKDSPGIKGCVVMVNIRLVKSMMRSLRFVTEELHLLQGQGVYLPLICEMEEGADMGFPYFSYEMEGTEGLVNLYGTSVSGEKVYVNLGLASGMEGEVTLTAYSDDYDVDPATITIHVHASALQFDLPNITHVEEEAFQGIAVNIVTLSDDRLALDKRAFADSDKLWQVRLPYYSSVTLAEGVLEGSDGAVLVFMNPYATAIDQAFELGIPYVMKR